MRYVTNTITKYNGTLTMWNNSNLKPKGQSYEEIYNPATQKTTKERFIIHDTKLQPILGLKTCIEHNLITIHEHNFINNIKQFTEIYEDKLGTLPGTLHLNVDEKVRPQIMPNRRTPVSIKDKVSTELKRLVKLKVITKVEEPTAWLSQITCVEKKNGKIRICLDPNLLNRALLRERYILPTIDDMLHELRDSKIFTKADLTNGYWHIKLDHTSSLLTTFQTESGRYRWLRLPFGINVASEIFQREHKALSGLTGVICIADDIIIHGKDEKSHNINLNNFLKRCLEQGIKLNKSKIKHRVEKVTFMGHVITKDGLKIDQQKIEAIKNYETPKDVKAVRRLLGMCNYLSRFIQNYSNLTTSISQLLKKDVLYTWSGEQEEAMKKIKESLMKAPTRFYNPNNELTLENDASEYGLGLMLTQDGHPVGYHSRTLNPSEKNYAQIEKEMLAIAYGLTKFHQYTYGKKVTVITDHKPLVSIVKKPIGKATQILQNLLLKTQIYNYEVIYKPGKELHCADALSRAPIEGHEHEEERFIIHNINENISDHILKRLKEETIKDKRLQILKNTLQRGWPEDNEVDEGIKMFTSFNDELTIYDDLVLRQDRIIQIA